MRDCLCADPQNCTSAVPGYRCKAGKSVSDDRETIGRMLDYHVEDKRHISDLEKSLFAARHCLTMMVRERKAWIFEIGATPEMAAEMERARVTAIDGGAVDAG